jgi:ATP-dependent DNA ligase
MITNPAEGIVLKQLGSCYRSGPSPEWFKSKNPAVSAVN